ncbi:hypothetical protein HAX54_008234, partial [Datura stramonium]|nr:hypothetical protein [Datura stramonium]
MVHGILQFTPSIAFRYVSSMRELTYLLPRVIFVSKEAQALPRALPIGRERQAINLVFLGAFRTR